MFQKSPNAKVFVKYLTFFFVLFFDTQKLMPAKVFAPKVGLLYERVHQICHKKGEKSNHGELRVFNTVN